MGVLTYRFSNPSQVHHQFPLAGTGISLGPLPLGKNWERNQVKTFVLHLHNRLLASNFQLYFLGNLLHCFLPVSPSMKWEWHFPLDGSEACGAYETWITSLEMVTTVTMTIHGTIARDRSSKGILCLPLFCHSCELTVALRPALVSAADMIWIQ